MASNYHYEWANPERNRAYFCEEGWIPSDWGFSGMLWRRHMPAGRPVGAKRNFIE
jgi:hypothetical protein